MARAKISSYVGVYLTPEKIEAAFYEPGRDAPLSTYSLELPEGVLSPDGEILDDKKLSDALANFWKVTGLRSRRILLALWGKKVIIRLVQLPQIPNENLYQTILSEAERYALFREEQHLLIDYQVIRRDDNLWIVYAVAPTPLVMNYKKVFQKAKLQLIGVDTAQMASQRGIVFYHTGETQTWTSAVMLTGKILITQWKQNTLTTWREVAMMFYGEQPEYGEDQGEKSFDILAESFTSEVARTISAESAIEQESNSLFIVSESHVTSKALAAHTQTNEDLSELNIIGGLLNKADQDSPLANVSLIALGAALWGYEDDKIPRLDLLRFEKPPFSETLMHLTTQIWDKQRSYLPLYGISLLAGFGFAVLLFGAAYFWREHMRSVETRKLMEIQTLTAEIGKIDSQSIIHTTSEIAQLEQFIQQEASERNRFAEQFVSQIHAITPTDTWIDSLTITGEHSLKLEGGSIDKQSAMNFMELVMKNFPAIRNIETLESQRKGLHYVFKIGVIY